MDYTQSLPLTEAQIGIWLGQQKLDHSPVYNTGEYIILPFSIDQAKMIRSIQQTIIESEGLCCRFRVQSGQPRQVIDTQHEPKITFVDLTGNRGCSYAAAFDWMQNSLATPIDLEHDNPYNIAILELRNDLYFLFIQIHHIAIDGFGYSLFYRRLSQLYNDVQVSKTASFLGLSHYVSEDRDYESSPSRAKDQQFWSQYLKGYHWQSSLSGMPIDSFRKVVKHESLLDHAAFQTIELFAHRHGCRWLDVVSAMVFIFWHYCTGHEDISLAFPVMNRMGSNALRIPCMKMNIIPIRIHLHSSYSLNDVIKLVKEHLKQTRPYQRYRYEHTKQDRAHQGDDQRIFSAMVNIMPFDNEPQFAGVTCGVYRLSAGPVEDIAFNFIPKRKEQLLELTIEANAEIYSSSALASYTTKFNTVLLELLKKPKSTIADLPSNHSVIEGPAFRRPQYQDVAVHLAQQAQITPDAPAIFEDERCLTYHEMVISIESLATKLIGLKTESGVVSRIAISMSRSLDAVLLIWACVRSEITYTVIDPQGPSRRNRYILENFNPEWIIYDHDKINDAVASQISITNLKQMSRTGQLLSTAGLNPQKVVYVCYTSGSTGTPKGVAIQRYNLSAFVSSSQQIYEISSQDRVLQFAPLHFDASVEEIFLSHCYGASLVLRSDDCLDSFDQFLYFCENRLITCLDLPTAYWHELVIDINARKRSLPKKLRLCIIGGEKAQKNVVDQWHAINKRKISLINTYGPTETTVVATAASISDESELSIGRPLAHLTALVMDDKAQPVRQGQCGELWILGDSVGQGYWNLPKNPSNRSFFSLDLTIEKRSYQGICYRTGDLVRINYENNIEYIGRIDNELKISGHRISPQEIEEALLAHPQICQAKIVTLVKEHLSLIAGFYIISKNSSAKNIAPDVIRTHLLSYLPAVMIPRLLFEKVSFPKNVNGKIDEKLLTAEAEAHISSSAGKNLNSSSDYRDKLKEIVETVLQIPIYDWDQDLFDAGAQSLQMLQLAARLSREFSVDMSVADAFSHPTLKDLERCIDSLSKPTTDSKLSATKTDQRVMDQVIADSKDTTLENKIRCASVPDKAPDHQILLTGATGFLGRYLLATLLLKSNHKILVLIRAKSDQEAQRRVYSSFFEMSDLNIHSILEAHRHRLIIWAADLSQEHFGLTSKQYAHLQTSCSSIIHNAAVVSVTRPYESLRQNNVESTRKLLHLAAEGVIKPFTFISTIATAQLSENSELVEDYSIFHEGLRDGYRQSKWAAESLVQLSENAGLPTQTIRLGRITGSPASSYVNPKDLVWQILAACCRLKSYPQVAFAEPWTPVDYTAEMIHVLHQMLSNKMVDNIPNQSRVFHLLPRKMVEIDQLFSWLEEMNYCQEAVPLHIWIKALEAGGSTEDLNLLSFFSANENHTQSRQISYNNKGKLVTELNLCQPIAPDIDKKLFSDYLAFAEKSGLIETQH